MCKDKKSCRCHCQHDYQSEIKEELVQVGQSAKNLATKMTNKYHKFKPEQRVKLIKDLSIGTGVLASLWSIAKIIRKKK